MNSPIFLSSPILNRPILIAAFRGWGDAQDAASAALRYIIRALSAKKFAELDPKNLTDKNEFNDLFFKKIDEIDDLIIEGASLDFILQKYNLISSDIITLNDTGKNKL